MVDEQLRAFVAIELPPNVREALAEVEAAARRAHASQVRWVEPSAMHLTLKFLGDVPKSRLGALTQVVDRAAQGVSPFVLQLHQLGAFPSLREPRVVWVSLQGETGPLQALQQALEEGLKPLGFPPEERPFVPHLTLGRVRQGTSLQERRSLGVALARVPSPQELDVPVGEVVLVQSTLTPKGAIYTRLHSRGLG